MQMDLPFAGLAIFVPCLLHTFDHEFTVDEVAAAYVRAYNINYAGLNTTVESTLQQLIQESAFTSRTVDGEVRYYYRQPFIPPRPPFESGRPSYNERSDISGCIRLPVEIAVYISGLHERVLTLERMLADREHRHDMHLSLHRHL